ncbi:MAG: hypothetical protein LC685_04140 [Actinobacteria bacterium]|nr:hypothetical protein [Actinomycetota bacterium]
MQLDATRSTDQAPQAWVMQLRDTLHLSTAKRHDQKLVGQTMHKYEAH